MSKIAKFDKAACKVLRSELDAALEAVSKKFGVKIEVGKMRYDATSCKADVTASVLSSDGSNMKERHDFEMLAPLFGMKAEDYGREIKVGGRTYKVVGFKTRASKRPVVLRGDDGKQYTADESTIQRAIFGGVSNG